jgi:hypothetical protein
MPEAQRKLLLQEKLPYVISYIHSNQIHVDETTQNKTYEEGYHIDTITCMVCKQGSYLNDNDGAESFYRKHRRTKCNYKDHPDFVKFYKKAMEIPEDQPIREEVEDNEIIENNIFSKDSMDKIKEYQDMYEFTADEAIEDLIKTVNDLPRIKQDMEKKIELNWLRKLHEQKLYYERQLSQDGIEEMKNKINTLQADKIQLNKMLDKKCPAKQ